MLASVLLLVAMNAAVPQAAGPLEIRIVYDNVSARSDMHADWGFAALVTLDGRRVLFDTGTKADLFMENLKKLGTDPASIEHIVISHDHGDHTGGIASLTARNPRIRVHMPEARQGPFELVPGVYSTGPIEGQPREQALVIETPKGLVILTGCSHPGLVKIVETAEKQRGANSVRLLLGGFHLLQQTQEQIAATIARLKQLKVAAAVPTHCSGDLAIKLFREAFPAAPPGAGAHIVLH